MLMNYHTGRLVLSPLCVGAFVAADICTKSSNTQRTENKTTDVVIHQQSQAPEDGYINVRNMLSA